LGLQAAAPALRALSVSYRLAHARAQRKAAR
jgi:hypothetical protein